MGHKQQTMVNIQLYLNIDTSKIAYWNFIILIDKPLIKIPDSAQTCSF